MDVTNTHARIDCSDSIIFCLLPSIGPVSTPYLAAVALALFMAVFTLITTFPVIWVTRCSDEEKEQKPENHVWDLPEGQTLVVDEGVGERMALKSSGDQSL
ncbi:hypothetical protein CspHIS471_0408430 [Cutaneotrichosporon sp. HIS471]|nr:hypothetical protein CspHIS471_0408430 [Cutaneotrichosporon sp. HIS471]